MRQSDLMRILEDYGPMTAADIAEHDGSHLDRHSKTSSVNLRLRALERQRMVCRDGISITDNGNRAIVWRLV